MMCSSGDRVNPFNSPDSKWSCAHPNEEANNGKSKSMIRWLMTSLTRNYRPESCSCFMVVNSEVTFSTTSECQDADRLSCLNCCTHARAKSAPLREKHADTSVRFANKTSHVSE